MENPFEAAPVSDPNLEVEVAWRLLQADLLKKGRQLGAKRLKKAEAVVSHLDANKVVDPAFHSRFINVQRVYEMAKRRQIPAELASDFNRNCEDLRQYLAQIGP